LISSTLFDFASWWADFVKPDFETIIACVPFQNNLPAEISWTALFPIAFSWSLHWIHILKSFIDAIKSINDLRICIQCKDHEKAIGNKAVQEISAGKLFWKGTHAIIVSKSGFTKSAYQLAKSNKVELINEYLLKDLEKFIVWIFYINWVKPSL